MQLPRLVRLQTALRQLHRILPQTPIAGRHYASSGHTHLEINNETGIAILSMNQPPANVLTLDMMKSLIASVKQLEASKCRGMILTSASKSIFTAGLDLQEMHHPQLERLREFYRTFQDLWKTFFATSLATAAAINGHSPAGGCVLSTSCEYRVMLPKLTIGLNEAKFGMIAPSYVRDTLANVVSKRVAEMALVEGHMFSSEEALKSQLIDEIAESKEDAIKKCEIFLQSFGQVNPLARSLTKLQFRQEILQDFERQREQDVNGFVEHMMSKEMQASMQMYMQQLQKRKTA